MTCESQVTAAIDRLFLDLLERNVDPPSLEHYASMLLDGRLSLEELAESIRGSREYRCRQGSRPVWDAFLDRDVHVRDYVLPRQPDRYAVIVEPRKDPRLAGVIQNVLSKLDGSWGLQIFHGSENGAFVREATASVRNVHFTDMGVVNLSLGQYSDLVTSESFWRQVCGDKVLIFQMDVILRGGDIEAFMEYDYVGAPWRRVRPLSGTRVGNGGLSLRTRDVMIKISKDHSRETIPPDVFHSKWCHKDGYRLAPPEVAAGFSVESVYHPDPFGLHKSYVGTPADKLAELLAGIRP